MQTSQKQETRSGGFEFSASDLRGIASGHQDSSSDVTSAAWHCIAVSGFLT